MSNSPPRLTPRLRMPGLPFTVPPLPPRISCAMRRGGGSDNRPRQPPVVAYNILRTLYFGPIEAATIMQPRDRRAYAAAGMDTTLAPAPSVYQIAPIPHPDDIQITETVQAQPPAPAMPVLRFRPEFFITGVVPVPLIDDTGCSICTEALANDVVEFVTYGRVFHCVYILAWLQGDSQGNRRCPEATGVARLMGRSRVDVVEYRLEMFGSLWDCFG